MPDQMRLLSLLREDPVFKSYMAKVPKITVVHGNPPWRLFVQLELEGRWAKVDLPTYAKAYTQLKLRLPDAWDMAIHCNPQGFPPPIVRFKGKDTFAPMPPDHVWCMLCRRPTVFRGFTSHPNIKGLMLRKGDERCQICGVRRTSMKTFRSTATWPSGLVKPTS